MAVPMEIGREFFKRLFHRTAIQPYPFRFSGPGGGGANGDEFVGGRRYYGYRVSLDQYKGGAVRKDDCEQGL